MPLLPSLIKRIDNFCKIADYYSLMSVAATDDKSLLAELVNAAKESVNPDVSYNLKVFAAMYQKALEINGGFNTLYQILQGMTQDLDPEEEESANVENLLNQIENSIATRASRNDSPGVVRELQMAASAIRSEISPVTEDDEPEPEEDDEVSAYETSILGYGGGQKAFEEEGGVAKFDPTGGVSPEAAQSGKGRGYSVGKAHTYKDWANIYAAEREKYLRDMQGPDAMLTKATRDARKDANVMTNLRILIDTLTKLETLTREAVKLEHQIMIETEVPHPKEEARLTAIREELRKADHNRGLLKRNLNKYYKTSELQGLQKEQSAPGKSERDRLLLQEKIKLQELRLSGAYGYGKEAKERQRLIDSLIADPNLPVTEIKKKMEAIEQAQAFTNRITKAQYDRTRTMQQGKEEGRDYIPTAEPMRGGGRYKKQIDFDTATYPALLKRFRELNNTIVSDAKKYVARSGKEKGDERLLPYVEAVSAAIKRKDNAAKFAAISALKEAIKQTLVAAPSLRGYLWSIRLAPHFKSIEEFLYNIKGKQDASGSWNLDESERATLKNAASQLARMLTIYNRFFPKKGTKYGRSHYMTSVDFYPTLINYIYSNILQEEPESLETTAQILPPKDPKKSKYEYDRPRTEQMGREQMREIVPEYPHAIGGGRKRKENLEHPMQPDYELSTFLGLIHEFQTRFNSDFTRLKQRVSRPVDGGDPQFKPFVDALADAIVKKDNQAKYKAIQNIKDTSTEFLRRDERSPLIKFARLMSHFRKLRDELKTIAKWQDPTNNDYLLMEDQKTLISNAIETSNRLSSLISKYFKSIDLEKTKIVLAQIVQYLEYVKTQGPLK